MLEVKTMPPRSFPPKWVVRVQKSANRSNQRKRSSPRAVDRRASSPQLIPSGTDGDVAAAKRAMVDTSSASRPFVGVLTGDVLADLNSGGQSGVDTEDDEPIQSGDANAASMS